jgi:Domain of unknown function (DUF4160)
VTTGPSTGRRFRPGASGQVLRTAILFQERPPLLWHRSFLPLPNLKAWGGARTAHAGSVSPTVLRVLGFRFYFFSREERRPHVHVQHVEGEANPGSIPSLSWPQTSALKPRQAAEAQMLIQEHLNEIRDAWLKSAQSRAPSRLKRT